VPEQYSRRSFLTGVLACGTLSATAAYLLPGGRSAPAVELRLATGEDPTGGRNVLFDMWNRANPAVTARADTINSGTGDERAVMLSRAQAGEADIVNLDVIHIPEFAAKGLITPIPLVNSLEFLEPTLRMCRVPGQPDRYWAAPFNTDVGMLFQRRPDEHPTEPRPLAEVVDTQVADGSHQFVAQLRAAASTSDEAFVINVLEHALSRDPRILGDDGMPDVDLVRWQRALRPLKDALAAGRFAPSDTEDNSREVFNREQRRYMRNWPVKFRELQRARDADATAARLQVDPLPTGILGGQSLALVAGSPHAAQAIELIHFLTDEPAQKVLAAHGLPPTRIAAYSDPNLEVLVPHLSAIREAVEKSRPRPIHPNYREFARAVHTHANAYLADGTELTLEFITDIRNALS
jgi:ABC-type glycerol-3-phosphate transport system substrate-binding protein